MIKVLTVLLAIAFLLQIPVFVNAEVYIPDNEYVGFYDHDGVYTVIGGVKNTDCFIGHSISFTNSSIRKRRSLHPR